MESVRIYGVPQSLEVVQLLAAELAHEANRAYCASIGDTSQVRWEDAPKWQQDSALNGVRFVWPGTTSTEESHVNWLAEKERDGWHYGPVKDAERKTHPCFLPYKDLPEDQRVKDTLFRSVVLGVKAAFLVD